jgi:hypothetical protein
VGIASSEPETDADCGERFFSELREVGMTIARLVLYRNNEPLRLQLACALEHAGDIKVSVVLVDGPRSIRKAGDVRAFAAWAAGVASDFPEVHSYVVWNEANHPAFWHGTPELYARLLRETRRALTAVDPAIRVTGFGLTRSHSPLLFLRRALAAGAPMDALSVHAYPPGAAARAASAYSFVRRAERVWPGAVELDEIGWQVRVHGRGYVGDENVDTTTEALQAERYLSFVRLAVADPRVRSVLTYRLADDRELPGWQSGLLRLDGSRRPSFEVLRSYLRGCRPVEGIPLIGRAACAVPTGAAG